MPKCRVCRFHDERVYEVCFRVLKVCPCECSDFKNYRGGCDYCGVIYDICRHCDAKTDEKTLHSLAIDKFFKRESEDFRNDIKKDFEHLFIDEETEEEEENED